MERAHEEDTRIYLDRLLREERVKLEITGGTQTWRLLPTLRHQKLIDRIRASIAPTPGSSAGCDCHHVADVQFRFPDSSLKRPNIALFCVEPPDIDEAWAQVPEAVIEIVSIGYEEKDLSINPPWYLAQGVRDVLVVEPRALRVRHFSHMQPVRELAMPQTFALHCGCSVTV